MTSYDAETYSPDDPGGPPGRLVPRSSGGPQRPRGGCVKERDPGPPESPRKRSPGRPPGAWGFGVFFFATPEVCKGSHVSGQQDKRAPGTPVLCAWGARGPGAISLTTLEGPQGS